MKKLSVILLTWNSEAHISACLDSLLIAIKDVNHEIIIVDNGSSDNSLAILDEYQSHAIQVIHNIKNSGVAKARNQALKLITGDYVLILDIDTVVNKVALDEMIDFMMKNDDAGLCSCKLISDTGEVQLSCRKLPTVRYKVMNLMESRNIKIKANQSQYYLSEMEGNQPFEVDYVIGACQLIRKPAMDKVGFLDERIFFGPEDADFCLRLKLAGWKIMYLPHVSIIHHYQQVSRRNLFSKITWKHLNALIYFFWKHKRF
jgi:GT2 family glycosyltransferase